MATCTCAYCGVGFQARPAKQQIYCSRKCRAAAMLAQRPIRHCVRCGKQIEGYKPSQLAQMRYCSRDCAKAHWSEQLAVVVTCEQCGKQFTSAPQLAIQRRFCSLICANKWMGIHRIVRPLKKVEADRGRRYAAATLARKCYLCGWAEDTLDACHIVAVKDGGTHTVDNIVMLCPNHHRLFDHGRISETTIREAKAQVEASNNAS